jgi:ferric-dicitrate binding protein FerR (iron transport regulator)
MSENLHIEELDENEFKKLDMEQKVLTYSAQYRVPYTVTKEDALQQLKARIAEGYTVTDDEVKTSKIRTLYWVTSVAASVILLFGIWFIFIRKPMTEVAVTKGEHTEYQLPDGSLVTMNADSKITFKKNSFTQDRFLKLDGEAFFSVKKGNKFTINTRFADIRILGTSFNIFAREDLFKVSCVTGKVSVTSGNQSIIITPGESVDMENGLLTKHIEKDISAIATWRVGEFSFENATLSSVFKEIERQFNVNFVVTKMAEKFYSGSFSNKNLVNALDVVCIPMGLTYEIGSNGKIFISEKTQ